MSVKTGTKLELPNGGQLLVTKGHDGTLRDGDTALVAQGGSYDGTPTRQAPKELKLGKRWALVLRKTGTDAEGKEKIVATTLFEALVILRPPMKSTTADLRLDGEELEEMTPKVLPSAD